MENPEKNPLMDFVQPVRGDAANRFDDDKFNLMVN